MKQSYARHMERKQMLSGKRIVGIDPAKEKHHATVVDEACIQRGKSLSFPVSHEGYHETLWKRLGHILGDCGPEDIADDCHNIVDTFSCHNIVDSHQFCSAGITSCN